MKRKLMLLAMCLWISSAFVACTDESVDIAPQTIENSGSTEDDDRPSRPGGNVRGESNGNDQDPKPPNEKPGGSMGG